MISLYILKKSPKLNINDIIYQTPFSSDLSIDYDFLYKPEFFNNEDKIYIMPATYEKGITG